MAGCDIGSEFDDEEPTEFGTPPPTASDTLPALPQAHNVGPAVPNFPQPAIPDASQVPSQTQAQPSPRQQLGALWVDGDEPNAASQDRGLHFDLIEDQIDLFQMQAQQSIAGSTSDAPTEITATTVEGAAEQVLALVEAVYDSSTNGPLGINGLCCDALSGRFDMRMYVTSAIL